MREIKFRAKTKDGGPKWAKVNPVRWVYGNLQVPSVEGVGYYMWDKIDGSQYQVEVDPETIGEFTSLKDRNGNDIYEGDIISFDWRSSDGIDITDLLEVRFVRGVFAFLWDGDLDHEANIVSPTHEWANVVGNIHDNPELIKNR